MVCLRLLENFKDIRLGWSENEKYWKICRAQNVRQDINKKSTNNKCWKGCGEKGTLERQCKLVQQLRKTVWCVLKKLKMELTYDPAIPLLDIYLGKKQKY